MFLDVLEIPYSNLHIFSDTTEFQILTGYASQFDTLYPYVEGRIKNYPGQHPHPLGIERFQNIPKEFLLLQNYPNPFNPETTIPFVLSQRSDIVLEIYNVLGQKVKTIFRGQMPAGKHKLLWNGRNESGNQVSSGYYFCRLIRGEKAMIKKMLLLR